MPQGTTDHQSNRGIQRVESPVKLNRITWTLPLSITGLLLTVVATLSWMAYEEVRDSAIEAAGERLEEATEQFETLLVRSVEQRLTEMNEAASHPAMLAALGGGNDAGARAIMERFLSANALVDGLVLWDRQGRQVAEVRRSEGAVIPENTVRFPEWAPDDKIAFSDLRADIGMPWYEVAAPVPGADGAVGHLVLYRRFSGTPAASRLLGDLVGMNAGVYLGTVGGTWTDLAQIVEAPEARLNEAGVPIEYQASDGSWRLGSLEPVPGTPWAVWVEFPRAAVLARANAFLRDVLPIGLVLVVCGGGAGLALSRSVTVDLARMKSATTAIAKGEYTQRVDVNRSDELGDLAAAFNMMAQQVEDSHQQLEKQVTARTEQLRSSEEQFRNLAVAADDAIITGNARGLITYFNPSAERVFGYSAEEVLGKPLTVLIPERLHQPYRRNLLQSTKTGGQGFSGQTVEWIGVRKNGMELPVELSLATWSRNGQQGFVGILRDITERNSTRDALVRYASELETANRELEAFSYSVSHDLRAPLRSMHGFSHALIEDYADRLDEQGLDYLHRVCASADRMGQLIDDLIELSRATRSEMRLEEVDLSELAQNIARELCHGSPERHVEFAIADHLSASGDRRLLGQVMQNLLENAFKFTSLKPAGLIEVGCVQDSGALFVRDNGAGFDPAYGDKLFGAFQRLHAATEFPGTGIGLALVQRIVNRHGGRVWAEGTPNVGATFYFTLSGVGAAHGTTGT
jgi:PAS domain S-box-containing protein